MSRVYNFSAGPAVLPEEVLKEAAEEMLDYKGSGMSVMEMSHRSKVYDTIIKEAEADLRALLNIPDNYKVLFLQGGASLFVCVGSHESDEEPQGGLYPDGTVGEKGFCGGEDLRGGRGAGVLCRRDILLYSGLFRSSHNR